jgi:hypothetical protein
MSVITLHKYELPGRASVRMIRRRTVPPFAVVVDMTGEYAIFLPCIDLNQACAAYNNAVQQLSEAAAHSTNVIDGSAA